MYEVLYQHSITVVKGILGEESFAQQGLWLRQAPHSQGFGACHADT